MLILHLDHRYKPFSSGQMVHTVALNTARLCRRWVWRNEGEKSVKQAHNWQFCVSTRSWDSQSSLLIQVNKHLLCAPEYKFDEDRERSHVEGTTNV